MKVGRKIAMVLDVFIHLFLLVAGLGMVVYGREIMGLVDVSSLSGVPLILLVFVSAGYEVVASRKAKKARRKPGRKSDVGTF